MAIPVYTLVNTTGSAINLLQLGLTVPASGNIDATGPTDGSVSVSELFNDEQLNSLVDAGTITITVDAVALTVEQSKVVVQPQRTGLAQILHNTTATVAPLVTDDEDAGYSIGSVWIDVTSVTSYVCTDASSGAAVWNWNGPRNYPNSTTDPVSPTPGAGDTYYNTTMETGMQYDGTRGKWLSVSEVTFQFGRNGNLQPAPIYMRAINGMVTSATLGYDALWNGTVVGVSIVRSTASGAVYAVTATGVDISTITYVIGSNVRDNTADGDFVQGDTLAARLVSDAVAPEGDPQMLVRIKWRAT